MMLNKSEESLRYQNINPKESAYFRSNFPNVNLGSNYLDNAKNLNESFNETFSGLIDRMASQMNMITSTFANFSQRLSHLEEVVDELRGMEHAGSNVVREGTTDNIGENYGGYILKNNEDNNELINIENNMEKEVE